MGRVITLLGFFYFIFWEFLDISYCAPLSLFLGPFLLICLNSNLYRLTCVMGDGTILVVTRFLDFLVWYLGF